MMNYEEFEKALQEEIQARSLRHIEFTNEIVRKTNEQLEGLVLRFEGEAISPTIYPRNMYESYKDGLSVQDIVTFISPTLFDKKCYPPLPDLTPKNAEKSITFSLLNKEKNKELLKQCPYKEIHDLAAVPKFHVSQEASFVVNNNVMQYLRMTKEEILDIAQMNTESATYECKRLEDLVKDILAEDGVDRQEMDEILPMKPSPLHVISNPQRIDGSCAILSDSFMQKVAEQIQSDELYLLPSSRHEMLVVDAHGVDSSFLKATVMEVNSDPTVIYEEDFLSNSIYKYNATTHSITMSDSKGLFHDKESIKNDKPNLSKGGRGKC